MAIYTQPVGDGTRFVMDWEDYVKHGFKEELATLEPMPKRHKLDYMVNMRNEILQQENNNE
jgi:hypothetical protein